MKNLLLTFLSVICYLTASASHIQGGEINVEHFQGNQYIIKLKVWRDCGGISLPNSLPVNLISSCGTSTATLDLIGTYSNTYNNFCNCTFWSSTCDGGTAPGTEYYEYHDTLIIPACQDWVISYSTCCRNPTTVNIPGNTNVHIFTEFDNLTYPQNSTPSISNLHQHIIINADSINLDYSAIDVDGDSLMYTFDVLYASNTSPISFNNPYTSNYALNGFHLDSTNGQIIYDGSGTQVGGYVMSVRVNEYDRNTGNLKSSIFRDFPVLKINATSVGPHQYSGTLGVDSSSLLGFTQVSPDTLVIPQDSNGSFIFMADTTVFQNNSVKSDGIFKFPSTHVSSVDSNNFNYFSLQTQGLDTGIYGITFQTIPETAFNTQIKIEPIFIKVVPSAPSITGTSTICLGDTTSISINSIANPQWTVVSGPALVNGVNIGCDTCSATWVSPTATTTYLLSGINLVNGQSYADTVTVTVSQAAQITGNITDFNGNTISGDLYLFHYVNGLPVIVDTLAINNGIVNQTTLQFGAYYVAANPDSNSLSALTFYDAINTIGTFDTAIMTSTQISPCGQYNFSFSVRDYSVQSHNDISLCLGTTDSLYSYGGLNTLWTVLSGDPIIVTQNFGCDSCSFTWASPSQTTVYQVEQIFPWRPSLFDTITVTVNNLYTYSGLISSNNSANFTGQVYLIQYNPADSTVAALDSTMTTNGQYYFNTNEANVYIKAVPNAASMPFDMPTYYDSAAIFLGATPINGTYCDTTSNHITTLSGINLGGNGFIAGNVYQGAGKRAGNGDPVMGLSIVLHKLNDTHYEQTVTDQDGFFSFQQLTDGTYQVMADHPGIVNHTQEIIIDASQQEINGVFTVENSTFKLDSVLNVNQIGSTINISVFPNPVEDQLNIQSSENYQYQIIDVTGKVVLQGYCTQESHQLDVSTFEAGVYLVQFTTTSGKTESYQIIKK